MTRSYQIGVLVLVLVLVACVSPTAARMTGAHVSGPPARGEGRGILTGERIASANVDHSSEPITDPGCPQGRDNRKSELCAQWKAADAAAGSVTVAWSSFAAGIVGLIVGALTLFFASRAAHWAKEAALHTQAGANEAERSANVAQGALDDARNSARPRVTVGVGFYKHNEPAEQYGPNCHLTVLVKNSGDVIAHDVSVHHVRLSLSGGRFDNLPLWSHQGAQSKSLEPGESLISAQLTSKDFIISQEDLVSGSVIDLIMTAKLLLNVTDRLGIERQFEEVYSGVVHQALDGPMIRVIFERESRTEIGQAGAG